MMSELEPCCWQRSVSNKLLHLAQAQDLCRAYENYDDRRGYYA